MLTHILSIIVFTFSFSALALDAISFYPAYKGDNCYVETNNCYVMADGSNACRLEVFLLDNGEVDYNEKLIGFTKGAKVKVSSRSNIVVTDTGFRRTRGGVINYRAELNNLVIVPGIYSINPELMKFDLKIEDGLFVVDKFTCSNLHAIDED